MRTEQQALKLSLAGILTVSVLGIGFGLFSGSFAILFDGVFSLMDAVMSILSITVAGLITKSAANRLSPQTRNRFSMGFWHFEPLLLAVNALLMMSVAAYAFFQAVESLLSGGREMEFGPAIAYAVVVIFISSALAVAEHLANRRIGSELVAIDIKGWIMAGGVTGALLVAFIIGLLIEGTDLDWAMPYIDPAVLAVVALVLLPVPFSTLRKAVAEIALVTPPELLEEATGVAEQITAAEGFADFRVYAAQQGRGRTVDVVFHVPSGQPPRPLEDWDRIRRQARSQLAADDPHAWVSISFTTEEPVQSRS